MDVFAVKRRRVKDTPMLPDELVEEIFSYLPAKSLRRFECLSRSWHRLITSSAAFHDLHSKRAGCRDRRRLFIRPTGPCHSFYAWQPSTDGTRSTTTAVEEIMGPCLYLPQGQIFPVTKSCHGLVLLSCPEYSTYYIWNPSSRDISRLPDRRPHVCYYGMGYCTSTSRYKVVRMYLVGASEATRRTVCEVLTLGESEYWRPAAMTPPPMIFFTPREERGVAFYNDNLHFVGHGGGPEYVVGPVITTFNVTDETFGTLAPPQGLEVHDDYGLTELDSCLCLYTSCHHNPTEERPYTIWILRDYEAGCWEKLVCIDWGSMSEPERASLGSLWIAPLDVYHYQSGNNGNLQKKIMFGTGKCKVFTVDPSNGIPEILFSLENADDTRFPTMGFFEESLRCTEDEIITVSSSLSSQAWWLWDVLSRLPARTVERLSQVSREWRAIIKDELFIDRHFQFHADQNKSPQVMFTDGREGNFQLVDSFINTPNVPPMLVDDGAVIVCSKPCHGLIAGSYAGYDFVCNPATNYYKAIVSGYGRGSELRGVALQRNIAMRSAQFTEEDYSVFAGRLGFGYDEEVSSHALVRLTYLERNLETRAYKLDCEFRYVQDMYWAGLDPPPRPIADTPPAHVNGKLYWMADNQLGQSGSPRQEIVMLNLSTREFEVLHGPPPCMKNEDNSNDYASSIIELEEMVCIANSLHSTNTIDIWVMMEDATGSSSWSLKHCIELGRFSPEYSTYATTVVAVDPTSGKILLSTGRALGYYDPKTAELETIYRLGNHVSRDRKFVPVLFQESLVNPCDAIYYKLARLA